MKKIISILSFSVLLLVLAIVPSYAVGSVFHQGFEENTSGWFDASSPVPNDWYGSVERVSSGTNGITSSKENWHAIFEGDESSGPFSRFDSYRNVWPGTWIAEVDVYLDPSWVSGQGFDYSVASNGSDGSHQRDFIFHVTKDTSTGELLVAGSNNTNFAPREDLEGLNHYVVSTAGWYTLQHVFRDNGGVLAVDLNLLDSDGDIVFTETRTSLLDTIPTEVGGNRYSWFTFINVNEGIAVDEHELFVDVPAPTDKDACKNTGWQTFNIPVFKNQGDCVSYVQSNEKAVGNKNK